MFELDNCIRKNIRNLKPYSSAREEFSGYAHCWLDANENPFDTTINRYPDPYQKELKKQIAKIKGVEINQLFIGNGSDEAIDLLLRAFCEPQLDKVYTFQPTYGMYEVCAQINNVEVVNIPLTKDFRLPKIETIKKYVKSKGVLFICSPNNPTGNTYSLETIENIAKNFLGIVVVDEAYIDFSATKSAIEIIDKTPNLVVLQTFSKAYGLAGLRLGFAMANPEIITVLNKIKPPYNVNTLSQLEAIERVKNHTRTKEQINSIIQQRKLLIHELSNIKSVKKIYPTETNFVLVVFERASLVFKTLQTKGIIVRNRTSQVPNALRITIGTADQNQQLIKILKDLEV